MAWRYWHGDLTVAFSIIASVGGTTFLMDASNFGCQFWALGYQLVLSVLRVDAYFLGHFQLQYWHCMMPENWHDCITIIKII